MTPTTLLASLWNAASCDPRALDHVRLEGSEPQLPSRFHVGAIASATIAAQALAAAETWRMRTGRMQQVEVAMRQALAMFRSERFLTVDGKPPADPWSPLAGYYQAADARWIQLHTNFPHHRDGVLRVLQCADSREAVADAISHWRAEELDQRLADEGLCAALIRSPQEWQAHPQAVALASLPLFEILRIGDAPVEPIGRHCHDNAAPTRPLQGMRVLDLSRVIAAPVAGRTLAQHGADVLAIGAAHLPNIAPLVIDMGRGKRSACLDLRDAGERDVLNGLIRDADVFLQAYRPGALAARGFSPEALAALRPGLIQVTLSAYGHAGPWAGRRGFDSLVQSATGIAWAEGEAAGLDKPGKLPCQALDHATGYLAAFGAMVALQRRAVEGGSWLVRVSLAQTGHWLQSLGEVQGGLASPAGDFTPAEVAGWMHTMASPLGRVTAVAPVERMSETAPYFALPPVPLGTHLPIWA
ncbi:MAG: carnitine dehydratase [Herminiimonas sp.]|nr:carnitine dehydratase [Herminiimonas sp.]MDB5853598.1 carnitine dehydratase [Herminiimonas sp.]